MNALIVIAVYLFISLLVGLFFEIYGDSFRRVFLASVFCTPLCGIIIGLIRITDLKIDQQYSLKKK